MSDVTMERVINTLPNGYSSDGNLRNIGGNIIAKAVNRDQRLFLLHTPGQQQRGKAGD
jgi:hypothetical protein